MQVSQNIAAVKKSQAEESENIWRDEFSTLVIEELKFRQAKNPRVSLRGTAKNLGLSAGVLSDIVNGKTRWRISPDRASEILKRLVNCGPERNALLAKIGQVPKLTEVELSQEKMHILEDWAAYPVLFSLDLPPPFCEIPNIAERLQIPVVRVEEIFQKLDELKLIEKNKDGSYSRSSTFLKSIDGKTNFSVQKFHQQNLALAAKALETRPTEHRDFTAYTFAGDSKKIELARKEIRALLMRVGASMNSGSSNDSVLRLSVQLFPV